MSESSGQWLKGCALGCGGLVVLFVLGIVGMSVSMRGAFDDAHDDRQVLEERFGDLEAFTPTADGRVGRERVMAFLSVREALTEIHVDIEETDQEMGRFEELADGDEPPIKEAIPAVFRMTRSMMGLPWIFGEIERTRNRALLDSEMGLGEYTYIYVMAYHDEIVAPTKQAKLFTASAVNRRVRADLRTMIDRQLTLARSDEDSDPDLVAALETEARALEADHERIPWQDGLPESIEASFAGVRDRLDKAYSVAAAEFDLLNSSIEGGGLSITMR